MESNDKDTHARYSVLSTFSRSITICCRGRGGARKGGGTREGIGPPRGGGRRSSPRIGPPLSLERLRGGEREVLCPLPGEERSLSLSRSRLSSERLTSTRRIGFTVEKEKNETLPRFKEQGHRHNLGKTCRKAGLVIQGRCCSPLSNRISCSNGASSSP